jgi:hypothetical protein
MLEVPGNFAAVDDSGHDCHVAVAAFAFGHVDLEDFREHFAPTVVRRP